MRVSFVDEGETMTDEGSVEEYIRSLTDRARLSQLRREKQFLENLVAFRRAILNGEDPDGL